MIFNIKTQQHNLPYFSGNILNPAFHPQFLLNELTGWKLWCTSAHILRSQWQAEAGRHASLKNHTALKHRLVSLQFLSQFLPFFRAAESSTQLGDIFFRCHMGSSNSVSKFGLDIDLLENTQTIPSQCISPPTTTLCQTDAEVISVPSHPLACSQ